jgi:hypothetical protein
MKSFIHAGFKGFVKVLEMRKKMALSRLIWAVVGECVVFKGGFGVDSIDSISIVFDFDELTKRFRVAIVPPCLKTLWY